MTDGTEANDGMRDGGGKAMTLGEVVDGCSGSVTNQHGRSSSTGYATPPAPIPIR